MSPCRQGPTRGDVRAEGSGEDEAPALARAGSGTSPVLELLCEGGPAGLAPAAACRDAQEGTGELCRHGFCAVAHVEGGGGVQTSKTRRCSWGGEMAGHAKGVHGLHGLGVCLSRWAPGAGERPDLGAPCRPRPPPPTAPEGHGGAAAGGRRRGAAAGWASLCAHCWPLGPCGGPRGWKSRGVWRAVWQV